jgi:hypothetical protein
MDRGEYTEMDGREGEKSRKREGVARGFQGKELGCQLVRIRVIASPRSHFGSSVKRNCR